MIPATLQAWGEQGPLDNTMGAMLLGTIISAMLYGASVLQTVYYFMRYPHDTRSVKVLVTVTIVLDSAHMAAIMHSMYYYLITHYYNPDMLTRLVWSVIVESIFTGITASLVQFFFAWRVWLMSNRNTTLTLVISLLIIATASCGTTWVILSLQMDTYRELLSITPLTITINALSTVVDVLISGSLVLFLSLSRTGFQQTDNMISRLILFFVNTGTVTSLCAIGAMIALLVSTDTLVYAVFYFCIGRLYVNSLLAALNARENLHTRTRSGGNQGQAGATLPTEFSTAPAEFYHCRSDDSNRRLTVQMDTEISIDPQGEDKDEIEMMSSGGTGNGGIRTFGDSADLKAGVV